MTVFLRGVLVGLLGGGLWWLIRWLCPGQERIRITSPASLAMVSSPVTVSGAGQAAQHNQLGVRVRDENGTEIGIGSVSITASLGQRGPFTGSVSYTLPAGAPSQPGRIEVFDTSPRDGNLIHLSSVEVTLT
jgi:hypothetical protein